MYPRGIPDALVPERMKNLDEIVKGLTGFISYWDSMSEEDTTGEYRRRYEHLSYYWRAVKVALVVSVEPRSMLQNGFWPISRFAPALEDQFTDNGEVREEYAEDDHYVGQRRDRPQPSFRVARDLFEGYFLAIRPADGDTRPVWIARAKSDPNINHERPNCVKIQYFRPTSRSNEVQNHYTGWDSTNGLKWKVDETQAEDWLHTDSIMTAWKSRVRKETTECSIRIPAVQLKIIHDSLARYVVAD